MQTSQLHLALSTPIKEAYMTRMFTVTYKGQPCPYKRTAICVEGDCWTCKIYEDRVKGRLLKTKRLKEAQHELIAHLCTGAMA